MLSRKSLTTLTVSDGVCRCGCGLWTAKSSFSFWKLTLEPFPYFTLQPTYSSKDFMSFHGMSFGVGFLKILVRVARWVLFVIVIKFINVHAGLQYLGN